jgi:riboflavin biosynthesis pyrimidine reductase
LAINTDDKQKDILRLFPGPATPTTLRGLYLDESLRPPGKPGNPFVYANFISSLDGRISLPDPETKVRKVPRGIANPRDWRLFQELTASADVLVTTGRYIRDLAAGVAQSGLPVSNQPEFADLIEWRRERNLAPQPAVAIVSGSINLPIPDALLSSDRPIYVVTGTAADPARIETLKKQRVHVLKLGSGNRVEGSAVIEALAQEGFGNIDMIAGAGLLNTLLTDKAFDRLYITQACRIVGGRLFDTLLKGQQFDPPARFKLRSLCYDDGKGGDVEQLFAVFDYQK